MNQVQITFGGGRSQAERTSNGLHVALSAPVLGQASAFSLVFPEGRSHEEGGCLVKDSGHLIAGFLRGAPGHDLETSTRELYDRMFGFVGDRYLYRIWHFVPRINAWETGLENYRLFCRGRANAFDHLLGDACHARLSAASAVGSIESEPVILFVAGRAEPSHAENPEQVPAYCYPPLYGPKSPSFARASRVTISGGEMIFISGTASIKGSETIHPNDCGKQVAVTLHNLSLISENCGLGSDLGRASNGVRRFVVYLRRQEDFPKVQAILQEKLLAPHDEAVFLLADICRSDLMVEIEASVFLPDTELTNPDPVSHAD